MFGLHNWVITFFLIYPCMLCHLMLKRKICKDHVKQKESKCFQYGCKRVSRRCESYMMYLKGDSPHQTIMIVCKCIRCSYISNRHNMRNLCTLVMFSHLLCFHTQHAYSLLLLVRVGTICFGHHKRYMC